MLAKLKMSVNEPLQAEVVLSEVLPTIYSDLQRIAGRLLRGERRTPTLDTGSLVHETYLRLARQKRTHWRNPDHLYAIAARIMRRLLVDGARRRLCAKHGSGRVRHTTFDGKEIAAVAPGLDVLALDDALVDLRRHDLRLAQLVELRFFGGLSNPEIAAVQGVSAMTIIRRWRLARAWLRHRLSRQKRAQ